MGTPEGYKNLWKNINWKDNNAKLAFFNRYFKGSQIVADVIKVELDS